MFNPIAIEQIAPRISLLRPKLRTIVQLLAESMRPADIAQRLGVTRGTLTNLEAELRAVLDIPRTLPLERRREMVVEAWRWWNAQSSERAELQRSAFGAFRFVDPERIQEMRVLPADAATGDAAQTLLDAGFIPELAIGSAAGAWLVFVRRAPH